MKNDEFSAVVGLPNIPGKESFLRYVGEILASRRLSNNGPFAQRLERSLEEYLGVRHCLLVANATVGLELALRAAGVTGRIITPSFTFIATVHAIRMAGLTPSFVDICGEDHMIDPSLVRDFVGEDVGAIVGVHLWGSRCQVEELARIAREASVPLMFDAAHAFGVSEKGRMVGGDGLCEVFSFHATKFFNTFEGGCVATNDSDFADKIRLMRNFGFERMDEIRCLGTNAKMSEVHAAMGVANLDHVDELKARNAAVQRIYRDRLGLIEGVNLLAHRNGVESNWQYVVMEVHADRRDRLIERLHQSGILARRYFYPCAHRVPPYEESSWTLPVSERISNRVVVLPAGPEVNFALVDRIGQIAEAVLGEG